MPIDVGLVHIDVTGVPGLCDALAPDVVRDTERSVRETATGFDFPVLCTRLEEVFAESPQVSRLPVATAASEAGDSEGGAGGVSGETVADLTGPHGDVVGAGGKSSARRMAALFEKATTNDAREDLVSLLLRRLMVTVARAHDYDCVMLGTSSTRLASHVLSATCKGNGYALPLDLAVVDRRHRGVTTIMPLCAVDIKEIVVFNRVEGLAPHFFPTFTTMAATSRSSISQVTEALVAQLRAGFADTTHHILAVAQKLVIPGPAALYVGGLDGSGRGIGAGAASTATTADADALESGRRETRRERRRRMRAEARSSDGASTAGISVSSSTTMLTSDGVPEHDEAAAEALDEQCNLCATCRAPRPSADESDGAAGGTLLATVCKPCRLMLLECGFGAAIDDTAPADAEDPGLQSLARDLALLPPGVESDAARAVRVPREELKARVAEYLLSDSEESDVGAA